MDEKNNNESSDENSDENSMNSDKTTPLFDRRISHEADKATSSSDMKHTEMQFDEQKNVHGINDKTRPLPQQNLSQKVFSQNHLIDPKQVEKETYNSNSHGSPINSSKNHKTQEELEPSFQKIHTVDKQVIDMIPVEQSNKKNDGKQTITVDPQPTVQYIQPNKENEEIEQKVGNSDDGGGDPSREATPSIPSSQEISSSQPVPINPMATEESLHNGKKPDNIYVAKKTAATGLMDIALLTANGNQLRYLIEYNQTSDTFEIDVTLIVASLILQVAVGILSIYKSKYYYRGELNSRPYHLVNNMILGGVFLITLLNVFVTSFTTMTPLPIEATAPKNANERS